MIDSSFILAALFLMVFGLINQDYKIFLMKLIL